MKQFFSNIAFCRVCMDQVGEVLAAAHSQTSSAENIEIDPPSRAIRIVYALTVFIGAFLLFQVQLVMGKYILPSLGGTASVWTTCLLVFQSLLLAGYAYVHVISTRLSVRAQAVTHLAFLLICAALLGFTATRWPSPITPATVWKIVNPDDPVSSIVRLLTMTIALPFLLLSTTGPLMQVWATKTSAAASVYRLFALSNAGSLWGLLTYPLLIEPRLGVLQQGWMWSVLFFGFLVSCSACALFALRNSASAPVGEPYASAPRTAAATLHGNRSFRYLLWLGLAACGSMMLLAATNLICQDVAAIPLLWVLPLALYLISFVICFDNPRWYRRAVFHPLYAIACFVAVAALLKGNAAPLLIQIGSYSLVLFAVCMVSHGELARLKPPIEQLSRFYLLVAGGGALGAFMVGIVAPYIFTGWWEFHVALIASAGLLGAILIRDRKSWLREGGNYWLPSLLLLGFVLLPFNTQWRMILLESDQGKVAYAAALILFIPALVSVVRRKLIWSGPGRISLCAACFVLLMSAIVGSLALNVAREKTNRVTGGRNFYGVLSVKYDRRRIALGLRHGATMQGFQLTGERRLPTSYYSRESGIGLLLTHHPRRATPTPELRIGVIGLGVGTLAAYGQPGDYIRFYEINPLVTEYSRGPHPYFTFVNDSAAKTDVVMGDARISLEREAEAGKFQNFDVLVVDAFNSDAIPLHLLTREAMRLYLKHLRSSSGIVAFHISNKSLDLVPVTLGLCASFDLKGVPVATGGQFESDWVLVSADEHALEIPELLRAATPQMFNVAPVIWTDDFSNVFQLLKRNASLR